MGERLRARGVTAPLVGLAAVFATSAVPARAAEAAVELVRVVTETGLTDRAVPLTVAALVNQTTKEIAMRITTKALAVLTLAVGVLGFGWLGLPGGTHPRATAVPVPEVKREAKAEVSKTAVYLLRDRKVLKELNCTADQRVAIEDCIDDVQEMLRDSRLQLVAQLKAIIPLGGQPNAAQEADFKAKLDEQATEAVETIKAMAAKVFKPSQLTRLAEIDLQTRWAETFADPQFAKELSLTDKQKQQIGKIVDEAK